MNEGFHKCPVWCGPIHSWGQIYSDFKAVLERDVLIADSLFILIEDELSPESQMTFLLQLWWKNKQCMLCDVQICCVATHLTVSIATASESPRLGQEGTSVDEDD